MNKNIHAQRILILDFGSQYSQLIARRIREIGVYCELHPYTFSEKAIQDFSPSGIILSGGPETVLADNTPRAPECVFTLGCPVLGICYGMQTMALQLGGAVTSDAHNESGLAQLRVEKNSRLLHDITDHLSSDGVTLLDVWMTHSYQVTRLPSGFSVIAGTAGSPIAIMADEERGFYGVQFHPEVTHTRQGKRILARFVRDICNCPAVWTSQNIIEESIQRIREQVGSDPVLLGLSGGVDSLVAAVLLHKAIGRQLTCMYIDHGLQRAEEAALLQNVQAERLDLNVIYVNAAERFLSALQGVTDPEEKRKIIGKLFIETFTEQAQHLPDIRWLAQGTIYSDVIESATANAGKNGQNNATAHTIKSHHNVGGLPENLPFSLVEPLRELFKDEVRQIGLELGLPYDEVYRHPFPGPGLAVRVIGEVTPDALTTLRHADAIFIEELRRAEYYHRVAQAFCVFLPVKSVGVVGDARKYAHVIALRAVETTDYMTANAAGLPHEFLQHVSRRIVNEVPGVSRVVYDITSKPPATIEWE